MLEDCCVHEVLLTLVICRTGMIWTLWAWKLQELQKSLRCESIPLACADNTRASLLMRSSSFCTKEPFEFPDLKHELKTGELSNVDFPLYMFMGGQRKCFLIHYCFNDIALFVYWHCFSFQLYNCLKRMWRTSLTLLWLFVASLLVADWHAPPCKEPSKLFSLQKSMFTHLFLGRSCLHQQAWVTVST
jgi:hypothetical protein